MPAVCRKAFSLSRLVLQTLCQAQALSGPLASVSRGLLARVTHQTAPLECRQLADVCLVDGLARRGSGSIAPLRRFKTTAVAGVECAATLLF